MGLSVTVFHSAIVPAFHCNSATRSAAFPFKAPGRGGVSVSIWQPNVIKLSCQPEPVEGGLVKKRLA